MIEMHRRLALGASDTASRFARLVDGDRDDLDGEAPREHGDDHNVMQGSGTENDPRTTMSGTGHRVHKEAWSTPQLRHHTLRTYGADTDLGYEICG